MKSTAKKPDPTFLIWFTFTSPIFVFIFSQDPYRYRSILIGLGIGLSTAPVYGPWVFGNWKNIFSDRDRILHSILSIVRFIRDKIIRLNFRGRSVLFSILFWIIHLSFVFFPFLVGARLCRPSGRSYVVCILTIVFVWCLVDYFVGLLNARRNVQVD